MWLPTKYWLLWILLLESAPAGAPSAAKAASRVGDPSSRLEPGDELRTRTTANDEARMRDVENSTRSHRGFGYYSKEMGKYVKLLSKSLGTFLGSLQRESPRRSDDSSDASDVESAGSQSKLTVRDSLGAAPGGNSLLSKINKGFNYTSGISKYLSSMPAVRSLTSSFTGAVASVQDYFKLIKPGTQWCGDGDRAKSFEDLGLFYKTDACCREHDSCPDFILSGAEKHGLKNDGVFTKLHCDCDVQFYQCLKSVHSAIALSTGFEYFNILKPPCFKKEHPVIGCNAYNRGKCVQFKLDSSHEKIWQWFENKEFLW
ncbi:uncharacterized protein [Bemisia tabaci]|uniref:uncharacterized protein n=1 Tax=Bemisia tabaci TaxID=7038 RepID=UPI003B28BDD8